MNTTQQVIERYFAEVWGEGDMAVQAEVIAPEYVGAWLIDGMPERRGPAAHQAWVRQVRTGLPDARYTIQELLVDGNRAAARVTLRGTHLGSIAGHAPTGASTSTEQLFLFHVANGQICAEWVSFDRDSFMRQLVATGEATLA